MLADRNDVFDRVHTGGQVVVCPICMKNAWEMDKTELIPGTVIGYSQATLPVLSQCCTDGFYLPRGNRTQLSTKPGGRLITASLDQSSEDCGLCVGKEIRTQIPLSGVTDDKYNGLSSVFRAAADGFGGMIDGA